MGWHTGQRVFAASSKNPVNPFPEINLPGGETLSQVRQRAEQLIQRLGHERVSVIQWLFVRSWGYHAHDVKLSAQAGYGSGAGFSF